MKYPPILAGQLVLSVYVDPLDPSSQPFATIRTDAVNATFHLGLEADADTLVSQVRDLAATIALTSIEAGKGKVPDSERDVLEEVNRLIARIAHLRLEIDGG